MNVLVYKVLRV